VEQDLLILVIDRRSGDNYSRAAANVKSVGVSSFRRAITSVAFEIVLTNVRGCQVGRVVDAYHLDRRVPENKARDRRRDHFMGIEELGLRLPSARVPLRPTTDFYYR
jgi:hypothetical protein